MKKAVITILILLLLLFILEKTDFTTRAIIDTKSIFDTEAVATKAVNMSITVTDTIKPAVTIHAPENKTITSNISVELNFSATDIALDKIWYNLDNGQNTTITQNTTFNTSQGSHTLYLFANDTVGNANNSESVAFTINETWLNYSITMTEFNTSSIDFSNRHTNSSWNISNLNLSVTYHGIIEFLKSIHIDQDMDFDAYIEIAQNQITMDTDNLPKLNKSAKLYLHNLSFTNPRVLRNSEVCPTTICTNISYSGGTLIFNVTSFTTYSAEESPSEGGGEEDTGTGGGGGGGGGGTRVISGFTVYPDLIKTTLKQGETKRIDLQITNTGDTSLTITISPQNIAKFLKISETTLALAAKEKKTISIDVIAHPEEEIDMYVGNIVIKANGLQKLITTIIEIESKEPLFDVKVEIPKKYLEVVAGEDLLGQITIFNLERVVLVDIKVNYLIKDLEENTIFSESETLAVETQLGYIKEFKIPLTIKPGDYILYIKVTYNGLAGSGSALFKVIEKPHVEKPITNKTVISLITLLISIFILITVYYVYKIEKIIKIHGKISEEDLCKYKLIKTKGRRYKR